MTAAAAGTHAAGGASTAEADRHRVAEGLRFHGPHQAGITTPAQRNTYFMAFDMEEAAQRADLIRLLQDWTHAAAEMTSGKHARTSAVAGDSGIPDNAGDLIDLPTARLTLTFGFGPTLFELGGQDRFGLAAHRPAALVDLPRFPGDQLIPERCGGDLSVQACADDPQVAEHAIRQCVRLAAGIARIRWAQTGFIGAYPAGETPRNQMGFKDGTRNIAGGDAAGLKDFVWVGAEGPEWMQGGSYMVIRPVRIALEHWDRMTLAFQEQTVGRHKQTGAPIGKKGEFDAPDFEAGDADGNPRIAENSHLRLSAPETNGGTRILRRAYSYDNGVARIAERWPPWRQAVTFDAGLLFQCYQRDPRTGFSKLFTAMSRLDMLNQFTTHVGSGLFACPPGVRPGGYIGESLLG